MTGAYPPAIYNKWMTTSQYKPPTHPPVGYAVPAMQPSPLSQPRQPMQPATHHLDTSAHRPQPPTGLWSINPQYNSLTSSQHPSVRTHSIGMFNNIISSRKSSLVQFFFWVTSGLQLLNCILHFPIYITCSYPSG